MMEKARRIWKGRSNYCGGRENSLFGILGSGLGAGRRRGNGKSGRELTLLAGVIFFHPTSQPTDYVTREGCCFDDNELSQPKRLDEELIKSARASDIMSIEYNIMSELL